MGFVIIVVMALYLLFSLGVVMWAVSRAKKRGKSSIRWGLSAALVMYLIPFWDWIPTVVTHKYYCEKEAGFWDYKTLDRWRVENPEVILSLESRSINIQKEVGGYTETHRLNQRFDRVITLREASNIFQISKREEKLVDKKNNEMLIRFVDYSRGDQRSTGTTKFWLVSSDCSSGEVYRGSMEKLIDKIYAEPGRVGTAHADKLIKHVKLS